MTQHRSFIENQLSDALGNAAEILDWQSLGGGCINHASKILTSKGTFFVKWNEHGPADMFVREAECLNELRRVNTPLLFPQVVVATELDKNPALLITDFLSPVSPSRQNEEMLGHGLALLHKYQNGQFGFYHDNYCGATQQDNSWNSSWAQFFAHQRIEYLVSLIDQKRSLTSNEKRVYDDFITRIPELITHNPHPALNHGDLWSGNVMHTKNGPALIDPASYYADREFDLGLMTMFSGFSSRVWHAYNETYPLPPEWTERNRMYMVYHYLNHDYLFGGGYGRQALSMAKQFI